METHDPHVVHIGGKLGLSYFRPENLKQFFCIRSRINILSHSTNHTEFVIIYREEGVKKFLASKWSQLLEFDLQIVKPVNYLFCTRYIELSGFKTTKCIFE